MATKKATKKVTKKSVRAHATTEPAHRLVKTKDGVIVMSRGMAKLVTAISDGHSGYEELEKHTKIPTSTLYVYAGRLRDQGIITATTGIDNATKLALAKGVKLVEATKI